MIQRKLPFSIQCLELTPVTLGAEFSFKMRPQNFPSNEMHYIILKSNEACKTQKETKLGAL